MQLSRSVHGHCQGYTGHLRRFFLYQKEINFSQLEMKLTQPYESEIQCNLYAKMKYWYLLVKIVSWKFRQLDPHCKLKTITDTSKSLQNRKTQVFSQIMDQKEQKGKW